MIITDKQKLINMAKPDFNISDKQTSDPKLYRAIKNLGEVGQNLVLQIFPVKPTSPFEWRIAIAGNPAVANDVLTTHYHVVLPKDNDGNWTFDNVILLGSFITAKIAPATGPLSVDVKVSQVKGTGTFKTIFQSTFNPKLAVGKKSSHASKFAINNLFQDDILRVDVLAADATVSGVEFVLFGSYSLTEVSN